MKKLKDMTDEERWQLFPIVLEPYQASWPEAYRLAKDDILSLSQDDIVRINHIGSTSVPGLLAKPTIDLLIEIKSQTDIESFKQKLYSLGYFCSNHVIEPDFSMMFLKGYTEKGFKGQVFHIHVRYSGDWGELYFCEYLRKHPKVAFDYAKLKRELMQRFEHHRDNYTNGKTKFIQQYTSLAKAAFQHKFDPNKKG